MAPSKSPFPGMDPYLEQHWLDVHHSLCTYTRDAIQPQLGNAFVARLNERLIVEEPQVDPRYISPDVRITRTKRSPRNAGNEGNVATISEPVATPHLIGIRSEPFRQGFIEIRERGESARLVTVIEFVSPTNKLPGDGRVQYRKKRRELVSARINLVEIDLTRTGKRQLVVPSIDVQEMHDTYFACVFRGYRFSPLELYPISLRKPLPNIAIPLRATDRDIVVKLQDMLDLSYARGGYHVDLDYSKPPAPPLTGEDATWAQRLLKRAKKNNGNPKL